MFGSYSSSFIVAQIVANHMALLFEQTLDTAPLEVRTYVKTDKAVGCFPVTFNKSSGLCFVIDGLFNPNHVYIFQHP